MWKKALAWLKWATLWPSDDLELAGWWEVVLSAAFEDKADLRRMGSIGNQHECVADEIWRLRSVIKSLEGRLEHQKVAASANAERVEAMKASLNFKLEEADANSNLLKAVCGIADRFRKEEDARSANWLGVRLRGYGWLSANDLVGLGVKDYVLRDGECWVGRGSDGVAFKTLSPLWGGQHEYRIWDSDEPIENLSKDARR